MSQSAASSQSSLIKQTVINLIVSSTLSLLGLLILLSSPLYLSFAFPSISSKTLEYIFILSPSVLFMTITRILEEYYSLHLSRQLSRKNGSFPWWMRNPWIVIALLFVGNVMNALLNHILIVSIGLGFIGCSISSSITRFSMMISFIYYLKIYDSGSHR